MSERTEAEVVAKYAQEATVAQLCEADIDGEKVPLALLPGKRDAFVDLRQFSSLPKRRTGTLTVFDPPSFVEAVKRFATPRALVAADVQQLTFLAYLEFHEGEQAQSANVSPGAKARHLDFKALYKLRETEDWRRWKDADKKPMNQVTFAQFLEDNIHNIAEPEGVVLLDITQNLHMRTDVTFKSSIRLSDGTQQLTFTENTEGATKGDLKLPVEILLGLQPFEGAATYRVAARLRIRAQQGTASFWYELVRPDRVIETAFREVEATLRAGLSDQALLWIQGQVGA